MTRSRWIECEGPRKTPSSPIMLARDNAIVPKIVPPWSQGSSMVLLASLEVKVVW
jgi:hypothetical protein